jgi:hypothetical protein
VCQGSLGYGTKPLQQYTDEDLKMFRWLLGEDAFGDGDLSKPLTQEIIKAMGPWFVREYFPSLESSMMAERYMETEDIDKSHKNAAALAEIQLSFENPGYSTHQYEKLCSQLDTLLADWDPKNLAQVHKLIYNPNYAAVVNIHGADILTNYLEPFMETHFGFQNTMWDQGEEWLQDWMRSSDEVSTLENHRKTYGDWMLALASYVTYLGDENYRPQSVVPFPKAAPAATAPTYVSVANVAPTTSDRVSTTPRTPTGAELQQAKTAYAELKKKPSIAGPLSYWDGLYAAQYWERQITGDQRPWDDESISVLMGTKARALYDAGQVEVAAEIFKLWIQDARDNLDGEWGLSDADMGEALRMLHEMEEEVDVYVRSRDKSYLFSASSHPGVKIGPNDFMGNFLTDFMKKIVQFVDEA